MNAPARIIATPDRAVTFRAWRVTPRDQGNPRSEAWPISLPEWIETADDAAKVATDCLSHKSSVIVLRSDAAQCPERRDLVAIYTIRRRSRRGFVRNAAGEPVREPEFYPEMVTQFHTLDFSPVEPWTWEPGGDAVGCDLTLVEG